MHLKALEFIGFKSFADKVKIEIEPGMTCIVGPNGCGKSNISDAIRWVLGEQSAKALRGGKMEDVIFNGTDTRKPTGMAEISLTMTDCENVLDTEYNEVTITRRVFRSGEGQYFINKAPCRLKDIQRLFMDTGVGTTSYSVMEQGRIDRVLSSRPEDRREIFEEASGITKFKTDKKEAIRKLEHTEANLLRLTDVIREVKRQIGSLQRQAGKARRYTSFRDELKKLDIFVTKTHLINSENNIRDIESKTSSLNSKRNSAQKELEEHENINAKAHTARVQIERDIASVLEASVHAQSKLDHTHEMIKLNNQRVQEYRNLSERDSKEIEETHKQLNERQSQLKELSDKKEAILKDEKKAKEELAASNSKFSDLQQQIDAGRSLIHKLREEAVELESTHARLRNQLVEIESSERSSVIQRERLAAEKTQLSRLVSNFESKRSKMSELLDKMRNEVSLCENTLRNLEKELEDTREEILGCQQKLSDLQSQAAVKQTKIDMLTTDEFADDDFPAGAKLVLDDSDPLEIGQSRLLGALASHITAEDGYGVALETALRAWLDAVVVADNKTAIDVIKELATRKAGSARLLVADVLPVHDIDAVDGFTRLTEHITSSEPASKLVNSLIGNVFVVDTLKAVQLPLPANTAFVTKDGGIIRSNGCAEFWMEDSQNSNPISRKNALGQEAKHLATLTAEIAEQKRQLAGVQKTAEGLVKSIQDARTILDKSREATAGKAGELQQITRENEETNEHLSTVSFELESLSSQDQSSDSDKKNITDKITEVSDQRERITADLKAQTSDLQKLEERHGEIQGILTEHRVNYSTVSQQKEHLVHQYESIATRVRELEAALKGRSDGVESHNVRIQKLLEENAEAESQLAAMEEAVISQNAHADKMREEREKLTRELEQLEKQLTDKRNHLEEINEARSDLGIRLSESKMKRQNMIERVTSEYSITLEQVMEEAEPEWDNEPPSLETIETDVAELRTKLEAMGPVNLVAIEEYKELEERYNFLVSQEDDLTKAKQQLIDMIRQINRTTSEMFQSTFDQININFQDMFKKLFDGGSAKLVLINEEDVLECGIEIIARPPGKRLQNISLLSGGERTLTAVALLFAIYMIKPSPFCLLDELDAALDDSNIGRFVNVLQSFVKQSQFLIITHNQHTIAGASAIYGITMPEKGVSKIVSMKFKEAAKVAG